MVRGETGEQRHCPVCEGPAETSTSSTGDMTEVRCGNCGSFKVTNSALQKLREGSNVFESRLAALESASGPAFNGTAPVIVTADLC